MTDFRKLLDALDSVELEQEVAEKKATPPSKFKPTHFHKSNLFGAKSKLMYHNGEFWHMADDGEGGRKIARWNGNPNNRSKMNPASVDGEIVNGKYKEYPKGTTFADTQKEKEAPQSSDELDADSADSRTTPSNKDWKNPDAKKPAASGGVKDGKVTFSDGSTFYRDSSGKGLRLFQQKVGNMIRRMDALVTKMNESIPNSLKAALNESDKTYLMLEALSADEAKELVNIVADLELAMQAADGQGSFMSDKNKGLLSDRIRQYKPTVDQARSQLSSGTTAEPKSDAPEPEAKAASDASGDKGAAKDTEKKPTAGTLAKFAKSGKGGLANDPDEVEAIKELQQYLTDLGFDPNGVDGKYGPGTVKGVKAFQEYFGAKVDGDAGPETIGQIIKLRSIGFKGGKTFVDFRKDMTRMEELLKKAGTKAPENSSVDFRDLISLVESMLTEALSDQEAKELADLVAQYDDVMNDGEFSQAIPKPSFDRYKKIYDAAKELDTGATGTPSDKLDGKDGDMTTPPGDKQPDAQMGVDQPGGDTSSDTAPGADDTDDPDAKRGQPGGLGAAPGMDDPNIDQTQVDRDSMFKTDVPDKEAEGIWRVEKDDKGTYNLVGPDGTVDRSKGMNGRFSQAKVPEMQKIADRLNKEQGLPKDTGSDATVSPTQGAEEPANIAAQAGEPTDDETQVSRDLATGKDKDAGETPLRPDAEARLKSYMSTEIDATDDQGIIDLAKKIVADDEVFALLQKEDPTTAEALRAMAQ